MDFFHQPYHQDFLQPSFQRFTLAGPIPFWPSFRPILARYLSNQIGATTFTWNFHPGEPGPISHPKSPEPEFAPLGKGKNIYTKHQFLGSSREFSGVYYCWWKKHPAPVDTVGGLYRYSPGFCTSQVFRISSINSIHLEIIYIYAITRIPTNEIHWVEEERPQSIYGNGIPPDKICELPFFWRN